MVYSERKLSPQDLLDFDGYISECDYTCGSPLFPVNHRLYKKVCTTLPSSLIYDVIGLQIYRKCFSRFFFQTQKTLWAVTILWPLHAHSHDDIFFPLYSLYFKRWIFFKKYIFSLFFSFQMYVRMSLNCGDHIEWAYYSCQKFVCGICCYCCDQSTGGARRDALRKQYKTVLPVCDSCFESGKEIPKSRP